VHGSHLYVSLAWSFPFSLLWPTLLTCSGRASVTATPFSISTDEHVPQNFLQKAE